MWRTFSCGKTRLFHALWFWERKLAYPVTQYLVFRMKRKGVLWTHQCQVHRKYICGFISTIAVYISRVHLWGKVENLSSVSLLVTTCTPVIGTAPSTLKCTWKQVLEERLSVCSVPVRVMRFVASSVILCLDEHPVFSFRRSSPPRQLWLWVLFTGINFDRCNPVIDRYCSYSHQNRSGHLHPGSRTVTCF